MNLEHDTKITQFCFIGLNELDETALRVLFKLKCVQEAGEDLCD